MKYYLKYTLLTASLFIAGCTSNKDLVDASEVRFLSSGEGDTLGILVEVVSPVEASGPKHGEVNIMISNLLEEEVFLELEGFDSLGYSFDKSDKDVIDSIRCTGGVSVSFHNHTPLRRLAPAVRRKDGKRIGCGCAIAWGKGEFASGDLDLVKWIGAEAKVRIPIAGYLRRNGKKFSGAVEVPIEIVKGQQNGAAPSGD